MKKLVLMLAVAFSVSLFSCGNADNKAEADTVAADTVEAVEAPCCEENDSCCNDSAACCNDSAACTEAPAAEA